MFNKMETTRYKKINRLILFGTLVSAIIKYTKNAQSSKKLIVTLITVDIIITVTAYKYINNNFYYR